MYLQKVTFYIIKGGLLKHNTWPFAMQKATYKN